MKHEKSLIIGSVIDNRNVAKDHFVMSVTVPDSFQMALPGQFVMIGVRGREFPFLLRPFSIYSISSRSDTTVMEILYQVVGKGTVILSGLKSNDEVHILGPLGGGFDIRSNLNKIVLIAGGIGIAPLLFLAEYYGRQTSEPGDGPEIICYVGAQTSESLIDRGRLEGVCSQLRTSTDDGSDGFHGTVTDLFKEDVPRYGDGRSMVYCCGPYNMMKKVATIVRSYSIPCQVSVEERMACGIGACLGCTIPTKTQGEQPRYMRACKEGPVFDSDLIIWR